MPAVPEVWAEYVNGARGELEVESANEAYVQRIENRRPLGTHGKY